MEQKTWKGGNEGEEEMIREEKTSGSHLWGVGGWGWDTGHRRWAATGAHPGSEKKKFISPF